MQRFFSAKSQQLDDRFNGDHDFSHLKTLLTALENHIATLNKSAEQEGADSLAYVKKQMLRQTHSRLNSLIQAFNSMDPSLYQDGDKLELIKKMEIVSAHAMSAYGPVLNHHRNYNKELSKIAVTTSTYAAIFAITATLPFASIATIFTTLYAGPQASRLAHNVTNTNNNNTTSYDILSNIHESLKALGVSLDPGMDWNVINADNSTHKTQYDPENYFSILLLNVTDATNANFDTILHNHYRALSLIYHPDKLGGSTEQFKLLSNAYTLLSDKEKRRDYLDKCQVNTADAARMAARAQA